ncbi:putative neuraminidase [Larkinella arboricola]|uniref:Putative neuraminidase n=1 Tax=Larkinella arboricola TaxID=643671 RepID=A0A327X8R6_LARAB|nr:sialidase family protein [Larkinella arboricola]RAK03151.1 putative neuraminidase [Larkinella arboricola]
MKTTVIILLLGLLPGFLAAQQTSGIVTSEFIYEQAPFPSCHASTLAETPDGIVASWFGGTREKHPDVGIWVSRRTKKGWTAPVEVANGVQPDGSRHPTWNPVLFQMPKGPLLLFYKVGPDPETWWGMKITSSDGGKTWSKPERLPDNIVGPIKNKPVLLASGTLLSPSSSEDNGWRLHMESSADGGKTWQKTPALNDGKEFSAIQPSVLFHPGGRLQLLCRSKNKHVLEAWSEDGGKTWSALKATELPNPNSGTDAVTLRDGRQLLVYNHTPKGRSPLNVALSPDGKQWQAGVVLEKEPGGEFSYPAVIQTRDGRVHITYTHHRKKIKYVVVDPAKLKLADIKEGQWPNL